MYPGGGGDDHREEKKRRRGRGEEIENTMLYRHGHHSARKRRSLSLDSSFSFLQVVETFSEVTISIFFAIDIYLVSGSCIGGAQIATF